ncbi:MAG: 2-hydroxyacyl-CoA dehydratase, partial [Firmicutes bacterium]|nr:2-hydroxyacyl-CoA dehydratase [Bacillota bacterium]
IAMRNDDDVASTIYGPEKLDDFEVTNSHSRCKGCENNCMLTISKFNDGSMFITGNRCEKGEGKQTENSVLPNLFKYKYERLFSYEPIPENEAIATIGIPRVLNMYENYPFWFTFLTNLGFRVILSPFSSKKIYESGMDTISSDTACYPAKLVHGHIKALVNEGIKLIFYPSINYERSEDDTAPNHYNCPIVATYPEVIANNMDDVFEENDVRFLHPFLPYDEDGALVRELAKTFGEFGLTKQRISTAVQLARKEDAAFKEEIKKKGVEAIKFARAHGKKAIVLAGRPYHLDPEINHGIDRLVTQFDMVVLTEDSVAHLGKMPRPVRVLDQWMFHSRLYKAAEFVGTTDDIEIIQLNSFGCGVDAVTTDQVQEICTRHNKLYTVLKIDEGSNLGAAKIRIRSLKAAIGERARNEIHHVEDQNPYERKIFTEEMRKDYTILIPQMSPIHFRLLEPAMAHCGYNAVLLPSVTKNAVEEGLKYINNDACYPTIVSLGQIIAGLKSGKYDLNKTAVFMSQTGGQCRASNYISLLRKALKDLKMEQVPVISVNMAGLESNPGFKFTPAVLKRAVMALVLGDMFMKVLYATRPYEIEPGSANALYEELNAKAEEVMKTGSMHEYKKLMKEIAKRFNELPIHKDMVKPKVGVVGEILVKYHPTANNDLVGIIEREGGEAVVLDLIDFFHYGFYSERFNHEVLSGTKKTMMINDALMKAVEYFRKPYREALKGTRFIQPSTIEETAEKAQEIISLGNQCGEGWLLTGEMVELIDSGVENIACLQPFACLPNHVTGKGMLKALRKRNPYANIVAVDYDPGASDVNQLNRIKLMMSTAYKNMEKKRHG